MAATETAILPTADQMKAWTPAQRRDVLGRLAGIVLGDRDANAFECFDPETGRIAFARMPAYDLEFVEYRNLGPDEQQRVQRSGDSRYCMPMGDAFDQILSELDEEESRSPKSVQSAV